MKCKKPYRAGGQEFPCRQCLPCRINRRKLWSARLMWELSLPEHIGRSYFVTLTYNDENLPKDGSVSIPEVQRFVKRLRKASECDRIRYFAVGEYGDRSWRPHYHLCVFGLSDRRKIEESWKLGFVHIGLVESGTVEYITGYCTKGFTKWRPELEGRMPEFCLMSCRPGIGAGVVDSVPLEVNGIALGAVLSGRDVPYGFRVGGRIRPMGTYLRNRMRRRLNKPDGIPKEEQRERVLDYWNRRKIEDEALAMEAERQRDSDRAESLAALLRMKRTKI